MNARKTGFFSKAALALAFLLSAAASSAAADLPAAASSPIAGITFDDPPLSLPVQRNFQMAMLTSSSELGRSCGRMEAYGWRMAQDEQQRVNQIFNSTVDRMRGQGFIVESKSPTSVSRDVTVFTADRSDKHLVFLWSAGEIGLVMVLCETSAPADLRPSLADIPQSNYRETKAALQQPQAKPEYAPVQLTRTGKPVVRDFTPIGDWVGTYTCSQGTTGGTLRISKLKGGQFEGTFRFYPTPKNPYTPSGKYSVGGEYDADSQRILINPGKWIQRPKDFQNTIIIGSFDPAANTFSGFFQGVTGCTSFEAKYSVDSSDIVDDKAEKAEKKKATTKKAKKKTVKKVEKKILPDQLLKPAKTASEKPDEPTVSAPQTPSSASEAPSNATTPSASAPSPVAETTAPAVVAPAATAPVPQTPTLPQQSPAEQEDSAGVRLP